MPHRCETCKQPFELEPGFYYGTGYVSYALSILYLIFTFLVWWILIGFSIHDDRFFWWMGIAVTSLIVLQPWLMRFSRVLYLLFFVKYDENYKNNR